MKKTIITLIAGILAVCGFALTLQEARDLAMENNPELKAEYHAMKSSQWDYRKSFLSLFPSASLSGSYLRYDDEQSMNMGTNQQTGQPMTYEYDEAKSYSVTVTQPIFNGGKIWLGSRINRDAAKIGESAYESKRLSVLRETESKFYTVLENQELVEIAAKSLESARQNLERAEVRYETGTLSRADILNMQSELASKELQFIQMENVLSLSRIDLANYLQLDKVDTVEPIDFEVYQAEMEEVQGVLSGNFETIIDRVIEKGLAENKSIEMAKRQVSMSEKSLLMSEGNFLPSINLQYQKQWQALEDEDFEGKGQIMLTASVPIFPLIDNGSGVLAARHNNRNAEYTYRSTEDGIKTALRSGIYNLVTAAKSVRASKLALEFAEETYQQMQERFRSELITTSDLLDSEVMLTSARSNYATSLYNYLRYRSSLLVLMGTDDEAELMNILK